jgi:enterochelin esterase-like enzyme
MLRVLITSLAIMVSAVSLAQTTFELGPDSQRQAGVPQGEVIQLRFVESQIYRNTERDWWIYVPDQYDGQTPAALMIFQDGAAYVNENGLIRVPVVFDNLIHKGDMPVTIAVFINPGRFIGDNVEGPARNRSLEYDSMTDVYSRFLLEEIIPEVQKMYSITSNQEGWAIGGVSSGGICAFTVAWQRPYKFSKVVSHVGSFTNIRGGYLYSDLVRQSAKKSIRVFL